MSAAGGAVTDLETLGVYAARADDYAALVHVEDERDHLAFARALPPGDGPILDWGCGPGHDAAHFSAMNLEVEATDAVPEMVALARAKGVAVRREMFEDLPVVPRFRGIWANFSLVHAEAAALPHLIDRAARALLPGGILHMGMKCGEGAARDALGRRYIYVEAADLDRMAVAARLAPIAARHGRGKGLSGDIEDYVVHLSRKSDG